MRKIPSGSQPRVFERATLLSIGLRGRCLVRAVALVGATANRLGLSRILDIVSVVTVDMVVLMHSLLESARADLGDSDSNGIHSRSSRISVCRFVD